MIMGIELMQSLYSRIVKDAMTVSGNTVDDMILILCNDQTYALIHCECIQTVD